MRTTFEEKKIGMKLSYMNSYKTRSGMAPYYVRSECCGNTLRYWYVRFMQNVIRVNVCQSCKLFTNAYRLNRMVFDT